MKTIHPSPLLKIALRADALVSGAAWPGPREQHMSRRAAPKANTAVRSTEVA
jgi:hypothetical protein